MKKFVSNSPDYPGRLFLVSGWLPSSTWWLKDPRPYLFMAPAHTGPLLSPTSSQQRRKGTCRGHACSLKLWPRVTLLLTPHGWRWVTWPHQFKRSCSPWTLFVPQGDALILVAISVKFSFLLQFDWLIDFCLHGVFTGACWLSSCGEWPLLSSWGTPASHGGGFSCCRARALGLPGFRSCGSRTR